jgi:hypothetical protein
MKSELDTPVCDEEDKNETNKLYYYYYAAVFADT